MLGLQDLHLGLPLLVYLISSVWVSPFLKPFASPSPAPIALFPFSTFVHNVLYSTISMFLSTEKTDAGKNGFLKLMIILCGGGFFTVSHDTSPGDELPSLL